MVKDSKAGNALKHGTAIRKESISERVEIFNTYTSRIPDDISSICREKLVNPEKKAQSDRFPESNYPDEKPGGQRCVREM